MIIRTFSMIFFALSILMCSNSSSESDTNTNQPSKKLSERDLGSLFSYYTPNPSSQQEKDENLIIEHLIENKIDAERRGNGIYIIIEKQGDGDPVQRTDRLVTHYEGSFLDGKIFDSSYEKDRPIIRSPRQGIRGWQLALQELNIGGKCTVFIPSTLGYGVNGYPPLIPPHSNLKFNIEILSKEEDPVR